MTTTKASAQRIETLARQTQAARRTYIVACNQMLSLREEAEGRDGAARGERNAKKAAYEVLKEKLRIARHRS